MKSVKRLFILTVLCTVCRLCAAQTGQSIVVSACSSYTIPSVAPASDGAAYQWTVNGAPIPGATSETYACASEQPQGKYEYVRLAKMPGCDVWMESNALTVVVGSTGCNAPGTTNTFEAFCPCSDAPAGSLWTLRDTRDNKTYKVVKIGDQIIMAQNLNYQKGLTWQENADSLTSNLSGHTDQIGSFWCPGAAGAATSTLEDCDIHGAVYAWPTAMLCDGTGVYTRLWPWLEGRLNDADAKFNNCRTCEGKPGGRGICPAGWHVPTAFEWAKIYDYMENPGSTIYQTVSRFAPCIGENAARNMKSRLSCTPAPDVVCPKNAWLNTTSSFVPGTDKFNFNAQPAPMRNYTKPFVWVANGVHWLSANESYWEGPLIYGVGANNLCSAAEHIHPGRGANVRCIAD